MSSSLFSLQDRSYLITGAASGIGEATAVMLTSLGANLFLLDKEERLLFQVAEKLRQEHKERIFKTFVCDLTNFTGEDITGEILQFGTLNGLVHCAGIPYIAPIKAISADKLAQVFTVNCFAAVELIKIFSNRKVCAGRGSVVLISSIYANVGSSCNSGYAMSKSALHGLTKSAAIELAPRNIRVNCIAPGFIKTPMERQISCFFDENHAELVKSLHPLGLGEPDDVAAAAVYLLSDAAKWVTGIVLNVDGGFTAQ